MAEKVPVGTYVLARSQTGPVLFLSSCKLSDWVTEVGSCVLMLYGANLASIIGRRCRP